MVHTNGVQKDMSNAHPEANLHPEAYNIHKESLRLDGSPDKVGNLYDKWAKKYDEDIGNMSWIAPRVITAFLDSATYTLDRKNVKVIDAGCGTGQVGEILVKDLGFKSVDGFDLSQGMVDVARDRGVYGQLWGKADLNQRISAIPDNSYDLAISCGVFTAGHVPPAALREVIRMVKPGGIFIVSTRDSYHNEHNVDEVIATLEKEKLVTVVGMMKDAAYCHDELGHYWAFKRL